VEWLRDRNRGEENKEQRQPRDAESRREKDAEIIGSRASRPVAIVTVQITDFQPA
jgi:hypothetical protein